MPDIAMCNNQDCPSRNECYRHRAQPGPAMQSYADFRPVPGLLSCSSFWPLTKATGMRLAPIREADQ